MRVDTPCGVVEIAGTAVGVGASGSVYLGTCKELGPDKEAVAVKVVRGSKHCGSWRRELRVVRLLLRKPHRNVLAYYAAFRYSGEALRIKGQPVLEPGDGVLVMERASRAPLPVGQRPVEERWEAERAWRLQQAAWAARVLVSGANALHWLHQEIRTIHRDLKLDNLLVSDGGAVKLADFSAAKTRLYEAQRAATRQGIGTTGSMAPELYFSQCHGFAVDFWSLGCAACDAFSGSLPYDLDAFLRVVTLGQLPAEPSACLSRDAIAGHPDSEIAQGVRELKESIRRRLTSWLPQDDPLCADLCSVLLELLQPEPELRPSAPQLLSCEALKRLAQLLPGERLDPPLLTDTPTPARALARNSSTARSKTARGAAVAQMIHQALERLESEQDLEILREDVHWALLADDPKAEELLQMFLQLPDLGQAQPLRAVPGWAKPGRDPLCRRWAAEDFDDAEDLLAFLQEHNLGDCQPGAACRLWEDLRKGAALSLRTETGQGDVLILLAHELVLDLRLAQDDLDPHQDENAKYLCLMEMHSIDVIRGKPSFPHLRRLPPSTLFDGKDGRTWPQRLESLQLGLLGLPELEDCQPRASLEMRQSECVPNLWIRCHSWTLPLTAPGSSEGPASFATEEPLSEGRRWRHWAWQKPAGLARRLAPAPRLGRCQDLRKVSDEGQTLLHAACLSQSAGRLLRLVGEVLPRAAWPEMPLEAQDPQGRTCLWLAASRADQGAVRQLLKFRSDPEAADRRGVSVLAVAAGTRREQTLGTVRELVEAGARPLELLRKMEEPQNDTLGLCIVKVLARSALGCVWRHLEQSISEAGGRVSKSHLEEILLKCKVDMAVAKHVLAVLDASEALTSSQLWRKLSSKAPQVRAPRVADSVDVAATAALQELMAGDGYPSPKASSLSLSPKTVCTESDISESPQVGSPQEASPQALMPRTSIRGLRSLSLKSQRASPRKRAPSVAGGRLLPWPQATTTADGKIQCFKGVRPRYLDHLCPLGDRDLASTRPIRRAVSRPRRSLSSATSAA
ncbi:unnamed protein product [Effrenium voratum]|uniref:Protein kinase domain-containing protein n=1 Tax=Effrenium voratum TaxID=2562239 RepID=A0AA36IH58_9DINO|nr:unnamed protein product [Effrenium voratum]